MWFSSSCRRAWLACIAPVSLPSCEWDTDFWKALKSNDCSERPTLQ